MKKHQIMLTFALLIVFSMMFSGVLAQTRLPGVKVGDTFRYNYNLDLDLDSEMDILPEMFVALTEQAKKIEWSQITITGVSGTTVTAQVLTQFKNGTQISSNETTDVATGNGNLSMFIVAANLNANDKIYLDNDYEKINETITRAYPTGSRTVNHQNVTSEFNVSQEELEGFNISGPLHQRNSQNVFWDKQSGSLVEMSFVMLTTSQEVNANVNLKIALVETSLYTIPEYSSIIFVIIGILALSTLAIKYQKHQKNPKTKQSPSLL